MRVGIWKQAAARVGLWCAAAGTALAASVGAPAAPGLPAGPGLPTAWGQRAEDGVLVAFREVAPAPARLRVLERLGLEVTGDTRFFARMRLSPRARQQGATLRATLASLKRDPAVRVAEPDYEVRATAIPNDPEFPKLWGLHNTGGQGGSPDADIDAVEAWDQTTGSDSVVVAVLDSGVDTSHPDLSPNILRDAQGKLVGYDFLQNDANPNDDNGHGTHVAGTLGARGNNQRGVVGVCHQVKIMPVKFLNAQGNGNVSNAIKCIDFAVSKGAHILNNSWGGGGYSQLLAEAILRARNAGVLFVAAAGNDSNDNDVLPTYPANYNQIFDNVISVGATTALDTPAGFSNRGALTVDLAAPGENILSTYKNGTYATLSGTSMATPHVSGAAALLKARFPALSYLQIKTRLLANVDPVLGSPVVRTGRLNVAAAMSQDTIAPGVPQGLTALQRASDALLLTWTASGDDGSAGTATHYELRYSPSPITEANYHLAAVASALPQPRASGTAQSYLLMGLNSNTQYYVALRAMDNVGNYSGLATFGPQSTAVATAPVTPVSDDAEGLPQFHGAAPWATTTEAFVSPSHSYTDSPGGSYGPDTDASLTLSQPVSLGGLAPRLQFRVKYDLEEGYDFLFVEVSNNLGESWTRLPVSYSGNVTSWKAETLSLAEFYGQNVQVRFRLLSDNIVHASGAWIDDIVIGGTPLQPVSGPFLPPTPSGFGAVAVSQTSVRLTWTDGSPDETGFRIDRRAGGGAWALLTERPANTTEFRDNTAQPNTAYSYRIVAFNGVGSSPAALAGVTTPPYPPTTPTHLEASGGAGSITLLWVGSPGATHYTLRRGTTPGGPHPVYQQNVSVTSYSDTAVTVGVTYYYTVSASNAGGESAASAEVSAAAQPLPPAAPTKVRAKRPSVRVGKVAWTQSTGPNVAKNRIYRAEASGGPWTLLVEIGPAKSYTDRTLERGKAYYYTVTAVNKTGQESSRSNTAFVKKKR